jgi:hypothetical protein
MRVSKITIIIDHCADHLQLPLISGISVAVTLGWCYDKIILPMVWKRHQMHQSSMHMLPCYHRTQTENKNRRTEDNREDTRKSKDKEKKRKRTEENNKKWTKTRIASERVGRRSGPAS